MRVVIAAAVGGSGSSLVFDLRITGVHFIIPEFDISFDVLFFICFS